MSLLVEEIPDTALMRPAANSQAWPTQMTDRLQQLRLLKVASEDLAPAPLRGPGALSSKVARLCFIVKTSSKLCSPMVPMLGQDLQDSQKLKYSPSTRPPEDTSMMVSGSFWQLVRKVGIQRRMLVKGYTFIAGLEYLKISKV